MRCALDHIKMPITWIGDTPYYATYILLLQKLMYLVEKDLVHHSSEAILWARNTPLLQQPAYGFPNRLI